MADKTKIEWTEATWNPVRARNVVSGGVGHFCEILSAGCSNCYAQRMQPRFKNPIRYNAADRGKVEIFLDEDVLMQPLRWKRPRAIFPCSMTDMFGEWVPDEWIDKIFAVMALSPQHTFQVLTKRAGRLRNYFSDADSRWLRILRLATTMGKLSGGLAAQFALDGRRTLPNVWLGVSCEDQKTADERIPHLLQTPAAIRWVSAEPLLGPIDFKRHLTKFVPSGIEYGRGFNRTEVGRVERLLDWIVVGGESGPRARPFDIQWARDIIAQCKAADVPVFVKQIGAHPTDGEFSLGGLTKIESRKGGDPSEWPEDLRVREMPRTDG